MSGLAQGIEAWLENVNQLAENLRSNGFVQTPESARKGLEMMTSTLVTHYPAVTYVADAKLNNKSHTVPVRVYHWNPEVPLPVVVYFHGGGHMGGSVQVYDPICRKLCQATESIVISVDYRLSPENPYPAGLLDGKLVLENCFKLLDGLGLQYADRLCLAGDSAGGAMSATLALGCQGTDVLISDLVLIYPSLDYTMSTASVETFASGFVLEKSTIGWYFDNYFNGDVNRREASPLFKDIHHSHPRTLIITAGFCPLRDEGEIYAAKLEDAHIPVRHVRFDDMVHAFLNMETLVPARCSELYRMVGSFLKKRISI